MSALDDAIREAARAGRLNGLSIVADPSGRGWQANARSAYAVNAWSVSIHADPVEALRRALAAPPATTVRGVFD